MIRSINDQAIRSHAIQPQNNVNDREVETPAAKRRRQNKYQTQNNTKAVEKREENSIHSKILDKYDPANMTDQDIDHVLKKVKATGFSITGLFLNVEV